MKKGKSPEKIYLAGRGALLRNLPDYISQSQQLSIDYFDPLKTLILGNEVTTEMRSLLPFMLSEPVGLASTIFLNEEDNKFALPLNLLPSSKISSLSFKKKTPILCVSSILFGILPLPSLLQSLSVSKELQKTLAIEEEITEELKVELEKSLDLENKFKFIDGLSSAVLKKNLPFLDKQDTCWQIHVLLNELQGTLDHEDVKDTWFDDLKLSSQKEKVNSRRKFTEDTGRVKLKLSGRYLVRATEEELSEEDSSKRNTLIDLNSKKQEALTRYLSNLTQVEKIDRKVFSIEGKGDLFGRYFTHFEYEITTRF